MEITKHNPDYKLIEVTINNNTIVYGESNKGENKGLEVYYHKPNQDQHYYSRRFINIPMLYNELFIKLQKIVWLCDAGHKVTISLSEYKAIK